MTAGNHYSKTARKAINRFYEHADTRHLGALQEHVSELFLAVAGDEPAKKVDTLWAKASDSIAHLKLDPAVSVAATKAIAARDIKQFAVIATKLTSPGPR